MPVEGLNFRFGSGVGGAVIMKFQQWPEDAERFNHANIEKKCISGRAHSQYKSPEAGTLEEKQGAHWPEWSEQAEGEQVRGSEISEKIQITAS